MVVRGSRFVLGSRNLAKLGKACLYESSETLQMKLQRRERALSNQIQGMQRMCRGGEFRGVATATPEVQNVLRRSSAALQLRWLSGIPIDVANVWQ